MNPLNNNEAMQLPTPVEQLPALNPAETGASLPEQAGSGEGPAASQALPAVAPAVIPLPTSPIMTANGQAPVAIPNNGNPAQASDDADLIEKEWVNKAKAIVEQNKDDPYKEAEELSIFKADYMKKRYNRTVKIK